MQPAMAVTGLVRKCNEQLAVQQNQTLALCTENTSCALQSHQGASIKTNRRGHLEQDPQTHYAQLAEMEPVQA